MLVPVSLTGPLRGSADIEALQRALTGLAQATNRPAINPGAVTGEVDDATMMAVEASMGLLTEKLPSWLYLALQASLLLGATTDTAKGYVAQYATQLTTALNSAAVAFKTDAPAPTPTQLPTTAAPPGLLDKLFPAGWYKTPVGMGVIALGLVGGYVAFFAGKPGKAA